MTEPDLENSMSSATSASQATVRRSGAAPAARAAASQHAPAPQRAPRASASAVRFADSEPEIRVNLGDVEIARPQLDADVFKPSLMTRLFGLFGK